jgi:hypothetical protein
MVFAKAICFALDQRCWSPDSKALASKKAHQDRNDTRRFDLVVSGLPTMGQCVRSRILHGISPDVLFSLDFDGRDESFDDEQSTNAGADNLLIPTMLIYEDELSVLHV